MDPKTDRTLANDDSARDTGAEFEENKPAQKIMINSKTRVTKPEYTGDKTTGEIEPDTKPEKPEAKKTVATSNTIKPDISDKEATPKDDNEDDTFLDKTDDGEAINELAKAAADKRKARNPNENTAEQKNIENLVENKTYFVPIGQVTKRRNTKIFALILVIIMVFAAAGLFMAF